MKKNTKKTPYVSCLVLVILVPMFIMILASEIVLRVPATYSFHFNDTGAINTLYTDLKTEDFGDEFTRYLNNPRKAYFQVVEKNGKYEDEFFDKKDNASMRIVRRDLFILCAVDIAFLIAILFIHRSLRRQKEFDTLRFLGSIIFGITIFFSIIFNILLRVDAIRNSLYSRFVGIDLNKKSVLAILMEDSFYKTYLLWFTVATVIICLILFYINRHFTADNRKIFTYS